MIFNAKNHLRILKNFLDEKMGVLAWSKRRGNVRGTLLISSEKDTGLTAYEEKALQLSADLDRDDDGFSGERKLSSVRMNRNKSSEQLSDELMTLRLYIKNIASRDGILFDKNPAIGVIIDPHGRIENVNKAFLEDLQYLKYEVIGKEFSSLIIEHERKEVSDIIKEISVTENFPEFEAGVSTKDGSVRTIVFSLSPLLLQAKGRPFNILLAGVDITAHKEAQKAYLKLEQDTRRESQTLIDVLAIDQQMSSIIDVKDLVYYVVEKTTEILGAHRCSLMLLDKSSEELVITSAKGLDNIIIQQTRVKVGDSIAGMVARDQKPLLVKDIETDNIVARKKRVYYKGRSFMSVPIMVHNKIIGVVNITHKGYRQSGVFTKKDLMVFCLIVHRAAIVIENANYCKQLEYLSAIDSLTGIHNHRYFMKMLKSEIERSQRYANPICLIMIDIDCFKLYNDTYGHLEGNHVLNEICQKIKGFLRSVDSFCRYGGDKFAIILPETSIIQAEMIARKIEKGIGHLNLKIKITLSMGITAHHRNHDSHHLILKADKALYQAKKEGGGKICCLP